MKNQKQHFEWIAMLVVMFLGFTSLLLSAGIIYLAQMDKTADAALFTLAGTAIGALGSMLANGSSRTQGQRQSDTPAGTPNDPISTESTVTAPPGQPLETVETETPATPDNILDETP